MPKTRSNYNYSRSKVNVDVLRNLRIVTLHNKGFSFGKLSEMFGISRQACHGIYETWKEVPFRYEDDKVIIQ